MKNLHNTKKGPGRKHLDGLRFFNYETGKSVIMTQASAKAADRAAVDTFVEQVEPVKED